MTTFLNALNTSNALTVELVALGLGILAILAFVVWANRITDDNAQRLVNAMNRLIDHRVGMALQERQRRIIADLEAHMDDPLVDETDDDETDDDETTGDEEAAHAVES